MSSVLDDLDTEFFGDASNRAAFHAGYHDGVDDCRTAGHRRFYQLGQKVKIQERQATLPNPV